MTLGTALGERRTVTTSIGDLVCHVRGEGRTLVFVHGLWANSDLWRGVVPLLAGGYRCVCVDLPLGAHDTPARADADLTPASVARGVAEVIEQLAPSGAVLVGNDTGGVLAQIVATTWPDRLDALVLTPCDAYDNFLPPLLRYIQVLARVPGGVWTMAQSLRIPLVRRLPIAFGWLIKHPADADLLRSFVGPSASSAAVRCDLGKALRGISTSYTLTTARLLPRFARPTLFAWADTKRIFPIAHARSLAAGMPDATVIAIPDSYVLVPRPARAARERDRRVRQRAPAMTAIRGE